MFQQHNHMNPHNPPQSHITLKSLNQDFFIAFSNIVPHTKYQKLSFNKSLPKVDKMFKCPLCNQVFENPVTDPCGHTFCSKCITEVREIVNCCPVTSNNYDTKESFAVNVMINSLLKAEMPCENHFMGCLWYGEKQDMNDHIKECEYACFECMNKTCKQVFAKKDITSHMRDCPYNNIMCKQCGWNGFLYEAEQHQLKCPEKEIFCPYNCGKKLKRKNLKKHNTECNANELRVLFDEMNKLQYNPNSLNAMDHQLQPHSLFMQEKPFNPNNNDLLFGINEIMQDKPTASNNFGTLRKISEESETASLSSGNKDHLLFNIFEKGFENKNDKKGQMSQESQSEWERMLTLGSMELEKGNIFIENSWNSLLNEGEGRFTMFGRDGRS